MTTAVKPSADPQQLNAQLKSSAPSPLFLQEALVQDCGSRRRRCRASISMTSAGRSFLTKSASCRSITRPAPKRASWQIVLQKWLPCSAPDCLLIEYGSGSSTKTRILLDHLPHLTGYVPMDISREHLHQTAAELASAYPRS